MKPMRVIALFFVSLEVVHGQLSVSNPGNGHLLSLEINGLSWLDGVEGSSNVGFHKDQEFFNVNEDTLTESSRNPIQGSDALGQYLGEEIGWSPSDGLFYTSHRLYEHGNAVVFRQSFRNRDQDVEGTSVAGLLDRAINKVSSIFPSFVPNLDEKRGFLSFGGRMAGTPCISVGELSAKSMDRVRGGNYGGPLVLFNQAGDEVVILSPLSEFMITNLQVKQSNPDDLGILDFGLMGSIRRIESPGLDLEIIAAFGASFGEAFDNWGQFLRDYHGKVVTQERNDLVNDYL
eukprot:maker-scaffold530_size145801-snap-gene-0.21 protein:Tk01199 transcript:maker-scaffold530_size145801-snap-gene-0.21-mRNA-1 annotation:"hypothetical protein CGI_10001027"